MKDLSKIEQKQLRHLLQEKKERMLRWEEGDGEFDGVESAPNDLLRESLIHQAAPSFEQLVIVQALSPPAFSLANIDRGLIIAQIEDVESLICLTKLDLVIARAEADKIARIYRELGYHVLLTSALTGEGMSSLRERLENKHSVLLGEAGAGRKSLLRRLDAGFESKCKTRELTLEAHNGAALQCFVKHHDLGRGLEITFLDGLSVAGFLNVKREEARLYYDEFRDFTDDCESAECLHAQEKGCAVKQAVARGEVAKLRYKSYSEIIQALA